MAIFLKLAIIKTVQKMNNLLKVIAGNGNKGLGKPEALTGDLSGFWSRRINNKDRLVYRIEGGEIQILSCRYHYSDK